MIAEAGVIAPHLVGRATDRTLQQPADALLKDRLGGQADGIFVSLSFEKRLDFRAFRSSRPALGATYTPQFNVMDGKKPHCLVSSEVLS